MIGAAIRIIAAAVRIIPATAFVAIASYVGLSKLLGKKDDTDGSTTEK